MRVCVCWSFLAGSGGPASRARFGAPHLSFGPFVLLFCSAPFRLGLSFSCSFVGLSLFLFLPFFLCATDGAGLCWCPDPLGRCALCAWALTGHPFWLPSCLMAPRGGCVGFSR